MPELTFRLQPAVKGVLRELVTLVTRSLEGELAIEEEAPGDAGDLAQYWNEGLQDELRADCAALLDLFDREGFGKKTLTIGDDEAERLLRAASAVRLKIHRSLLRHVRDAELERGQLDMRRLSGDQQRAYAAYLFLAALQEALVQALDPESSEVEPPEQEN
ncbi:MAG: DUF2017 family protein [Opitutales bacterium]